MNELDPAGCGLLIQAVIVTACNDYRQALKQLARRPGSMGAAGLVFEIEAFLRGEWFAAICELDAEALIEGLKKECGCREGRRGNEGG